MKLSLFFAATLVSAAVAIPAIASIPEIDISNLEKRLTVSNFRMASCSQPTDVLQISEITLTPNPPAEGKNTIKASGMLSAPVEKGAKVEITAKFGIMTLFHKKMDLCDLASKEMQMSCPLQKGPITIEKSFDIPKKKVPHGKVAVSIRATTADGKSLSCYNVVLSV